METEQSVVIYLGGGEEGSFLEISYLSLVYRSIAITLHYKQQFVMVFIAIQLRTD